MQVQINGKRLQLNNKSVIGIGGEATIFKHKDCAIKIYIEPNADRAAKLKAMLPKVTQLPQAVIAPQQVVFDENGKQVVGFTMRLLDSNYIEMRELTRKKFHSQMGVTVRDIARLFLNIGQNLQYIHQAGMIVGDLNDLNLMFHHDDALFIDVDSFQFDQFPCMVGTEAFTDPALYGINFAEKPVFKPENDWYAFAVLLFKSLLLTHPYGGIHPDVKLLPHRALQGISVFHPDVTYPKIAHSPELLSDGLAYEFQQWFEQRKRAAFPLNVLHDYINELTTCPHCSAAYPRNRAQCPICSAAVPVSITLAVSGARALLRNAGEIIAWYIMQHSANLITHENGKAIYHRIEGERLVRSLKLFDAIPTAKYAFMGNYLVISPTPTSDELLVVDVSGEAPQGAHKLTTEAFGQGQRIFGANQNALYRIANGYLMRGEFRYGQYVERAIMAVADQQTWFTVAPDSDQVFGFFRTFNTHDFWLLNGTERIDVDLPELEPFEFMTDIAVNFSRDSLLVLRQTQYQGVERIRIDEISLKGSSLHSRVTRDIDLFTPLDAHTYARNLILTATDKGVVRETLDTNSTATFTQTENIVKSGDRLFRYGSGLLALGDNTVMHLVV